MLSLTCSLASMSTVEDLVTICLALSAPLRAKAISSPLAYTKLIVNISS